MPAWLIVLWLQAAVLVEPAASRLAPSPYEAEARSPRRRDVRLVLALGPSARRHPISGILALAPDPYGPRERSLPRATSRVRVAVHAPSADSTAIHALAPSPYGGVPASLLAPIPY